jgi:riboflavin synthase
MFTGIVEEKGIVAERGKRLVVACKKVLEDLKTGDSIAVNGCCLTVTSFSNNSFSADLSEETQRITNLRRLKLGDIVNLERSLRMGDRFGGHIVTGHIDGLCELFDVDGSIFWFKLPSELSRYIIKKGSVAIDGVSLTVSDISDSRLSVSIIPHTLKATNFGNMRIGYLANIEVDILAKFMEKLNRKSKLSKLLEREEILKNK